MKKIKSISLFIIMVALALGEQDSLNTSKISLKKALEVLARNHGLNFIYRDDIVKNIEIDAPGKHIDYREYLKEILTPEGLDFKEYQERQIIIFPRKNKESYEFHGGVIDAGSHQTLPYANIQVKGSNLGVAADDSGWFLLTVPQSDSLTLQVSCIGYKDEEFIISAAEVGSPLTLPLKMQSIPIKAINVTGQRTKELKIDDQGGEMTIDADVVNNLPSLGSSDILRGLQMLPGISGVSDGSSGLGIHGGTPDENLIILDDMPLYHMDHFYGLVNAFGNTKLDNVKIYKGGFPAKYGERTSAVLELNGSKNISSQKYFNVAMDFLSSQLYLELPIKNRHLAEFSYRKSHPNFLQTNWFKNIGNYGKMKNLPIGDDISSSTHNSLPDFYDASFRYSFLFGDSSTVNFRYYTNSNNVDVGVNDETYTGDDDNIDFNGITDITDQKNSGEQLNLEHYFSKNNKVELLFGYSKYMSENLAIYPLANDTLSNESNTITFTQTNRIQEYNFKLDHAYSLSRYMKFETGVKITRTSLQFTYTAYDTSSLKQNDWATIAAAYTQGSFKIWNKINICSGLRFSHQNLNKDLYFEPRLSMNMKLHENWTLKTAWGKYHQYLNRISSDNIVAGNSDFWLMTDEKTKPGYSEHYILGLTGKKGKWLLNIEGYIKNLKGQKSFIAYLPTSYNSYTSAELLVDGIGYAQGVESVIYYRGYIFNGWLSYNYGKVMNKFEGINDFDYFPANHDHRHELKLVTNWHWKNFHFSINWIEATGAPYTKIQGKYYINDLNDEFVYFRYGKINSSRLPNYRRIDVDFSYKFNFGQNSLKTGISIYNLTDYENILRRINYIGSNDKVTETDILMLGFTPTLYINLEFKK